MGMVVDAPQSGFDPQCGVLAVGHGTRHSAGLAEFHEVVRQLSQRLSPTPVEPCFLELAEPTIAVGFERLVARGVRRVTIAPLILFAAGHAKRDIPEAVAAVAVRHPEVAWRQAAHLGLHPQLLELSTERYDQALAGLSSIGLAETLLVMVGRGSSDLQAAAETRAFAELRGTASRVARVETAFVALCEPRLDDVLRSAAEAGRFRRVVVQPHLLFSGEMLQTIAERVATARAAHPGIDWRTTAHLGVDRLLIDAILARINESSMSPER